MIFLFYLVYLIFFLPALYQAFIGTLAMKKKIKISFLTVSLISVLTFVFMASVYFYHAYDRKGDDGHSMGLIGPSIMIIKGAIALLVTIVVQYIILKTTK